MDTQPLPIGFACDHAGVAMKRALMEHVAALGYEVRDFGTDTTDSCDYPDYAHPLAEAVEAGAVYPGIGLCGSGNGIGMTLNKHQSIRAALCWNEEIARLSRAHNDANVLVLPARFVTVEEAVRMVDIFLTTTFDGGRHRRRVEKIPVV
ncbi:ribose 5-phosphate isomerase B [Tannerella sp. oral taxon 808]|nr:ribose 5-phosphate isomerase B [Tannerella sp. oral taxon 808]